MSDLPTEVPGFDSPEFAMWQAARDAFENELIDGVTRPLRAKEAVTLAEAYASGDQDRIDHLERGIEMMPKLIEQILISRGVVPLPGAESTLVDYGEFVRQRQAITYSKAHGFSPSQAYVLLYHPEDPTIGITTNALLSMYSDIPPTE